jgi:hypothetical protein
LVSFGTGMCFLSAIMKTPCIILFKSIFRKVNIATIQTQPVFLVCNNPNGFGNNK